MYAFLISGKVLAMTLQDAQRTYNGSATSQAQGLSVNYYSEYLQWHS